MGSEAKPWPHMSDLVEDHPPPPPQQQTRAASASASEEYRFPCAKSSKGLDIATTLLVEEAVKKFNACEQAVYEEKVRRRAARKARKVELVEWYKNATNAELHEKFKDFHEWLAVQDNTAEEVLKRTDDAIFLTTEVESRNYQLFKGGKRKEVSLTGDPLYDEHLPILSYHIGTILAEVIVNAHKTARLNMYSSNYLMCWFLAGYGFEGFDSSVEFNQGIEKLEGQIERGEVESLSVLGRLLRTQGLMPLPKEVRRAEGEGCDDPGGIKFKALMCRLLEENDEQMKKEVANRLDLGVRLLRDWAELEKTILEEMLLASRVFAIQKYHGMGTEELYNLFRDTMAECSKDGVTDLTETSAVDMMDLRSLAEELRLRYMSIGGYFNGDRLFDIEPEDLMVYVPILTANIGAKAAKVLLSSNSLKDYNVYVNTECMATWLLGLGFPKNHSKTFLGNVQEVQSKLDSGDLEPLWEFSMLLRDKDLPWPHSYFQASDDAGLS
ncbi:hypothetical protein HOP50_18g82630 [Chloropicon primus]|uniref:Uncharacterized protein n=1 Tax=Chloropicon primus TaxID=1764295 RepID=A0A5B8N0Y8_9CHLO|nr:hypothetical protein A3770_18p82400 [Chloropicon primus]UPR04918.1 hypothetical protein HOP50_18g82630 [Chloropicon primus]|eukprot:QDZ25722.1 hypothetical protein A3770_18p82400 [Chloropicon primus]